MTEVSEFAFYLGKLLFLQQMEDGIINCFDFSKVLPGWFRGLLINNDKVTTLSVDPKKIGNEFIQTHLIPLRVGSAKGFLFKMVLDAPDLRLH